MTLRKKHSVIWAPSGVTDAINGTADFPGACNFLSNLIPTQNQKGMVMPRPAAMAVASLSDYAGGPISCLLAVGNMVYGMYPSTTYSGQDVPFVYDLASAAFSTVTGLSAGNLPTSPASSGAWTPPTAAQVASRIIFTHPGFAGGLSNNTSVVPSSGNITNGSNIITGYPTLWGPAIGTILWGAGIPAGTTVTAWEQTDINVDGSGSSGGTSFTVTSATGIAVGQVILLPTGQTDTVGSVAGTTIGLYSVTLSGNFSSANVTFVTATLTMSQNATATATNHEFYTTSPVSNKFGWLDISGFSAVITASTNIDTPIVVGDFDITGIQPGMTVSGGGIQAGTTVLAAGHFSFTIAMSVTGGSTAASGIVVQVGTASPASFIDGSVWYGQSVAGPGLNAGTTFATITNPGGVPTGQTGTAVLSSPATSNETGAPYVVTFSFILLSNFATASNAAEAITVAGGTPSSPLWGAGDLQVLPLANVPVFVTEYGGSACFGVNTTSPQTAAVVLSDAGVPCQCSNASQVITFQNGIPVTAGAGLPLQNELGGIIQSLIVFQGGALLQQITGTPAQEDLSLNTAQVATGTLAPNSIASTPKGLIFQAPDGLRLLDFSGQVHDPIGTKGDGILAPFLNCQVPSRSAGAFSGNVYRITVSWVPPPFLQGIYGVTARTDEFWLHLDTGKFSGPHTCTMDLIQPWISKNSFVGAPQFDRGTLWESDPYTTYTSIYLENSNQLSWVARSILLPDDASLEANALVESSVFASMAAGTSWSASIIDDQGVMQATAPVTMQGATVTRAQVPIYWGNAIAFRQAAVQLVGTSQAQTVIGPIQLRYQKLGYPLPVYPSTSVYISEDYELPTVLYYGADPTGASDNSAAFSAAAAASNLVIIPPGTYYFASQWSLTVAAGERVTFLGSGMDNTILAFASGSNGWNLTLGSITSSVALEGMTFATKGASSGTTGLTVSQGGVTGPPVPNNLLQDVGFRGFDKWGGSDYWGNAATITANCVNYIGCAFSGAGNAGVGLNLPGQSNYSVVHNLYGCCFWDLNAGIAYGSNTQGVTVNSCNFTGVNFGIYMGASVTGVTQLYVTESQFGECVNGGILLNSGCPDVCILQNLFILPSTTSVAMQFNNYADTIIMGNNIQGYSTSVSNGIVFETYGSESSVVTGNNIKTCSAGIDLQSASEYVNVQSNCYKGNTSNVTNAGSNNTVGGGSQ